MIRLDPCLAHFDVAFICSASAVDRPCGLFAAAIAIDPSAPEPVHSAAEAIRAACAVDDRCRSACGGACSPTPAGGAWPVPWLAAVGLARGLTPEWR